VTVARLPGRVAGGSTGLVVAPASGPARTYWSGSVGEGADLLPGGDDVACPGPAGLDS